jgi:hypothetical protein
VLLHGEDIKSIGMVAISQCCSDVAIHDKERGQLGYRLLEPIERAMLTHFFTRKCRLKQFAVENTPTLDHLPLSDPEP